MLRSRLYSPLKGLLLKTYKGHNYDVLDIRCSFDNACLCSGSADKNVFLWDVATGNPTRKWKVLLWARIEKKTE